MIPDDLLSLLRCPLTQQPLTVADQQTIDHAKTLINPPGGSLDAALIREDRQMLYPIRDGIPVLLVEEGIPLR